MNRLFQAKDGTSKKIVVPSSQHAIASTDISEEASSVLRRLNSAGYMACLVGGSVRDLLLRHTPKDFDIATQAHPPQIRKLFRNCRLIGRRFRLAHIYFGRTIIEVATFRGRHNSQKNNNSYGDIHEDAWQRDFTINALYYNSEDASIIDFTGGLYDLQHKIVRLIGKPKKRYREDPVRMLRAIRFIAKLGFTMDPKTEKPIRSLAPLLRTISHSRLFHEVIKLYHSGKAFLTHQLLNQYGLFEQLFPSCFHATQHNQPACLLIQKALQNTDQRIAKGQPITPAFLYAVLLWAPLDLKINQLKTESNAYLCKLEQASKIIIHEQTLITGIPKYHVQTIRDIWYLQYHLTRREKKNILTTLQHPRFRAAYDFLILRSHVHEVPSSLVKWWTDFQTEDTELQAKMLKALFPTQHKKRHKRKPK